MEDTRIITLDEKNLYRYPLCIYKNTKKDEYRAKADWMIKELKNGLRYKVLEHATKGIVGTIEYIPGEYAWRSVECKDFMFVHCIFIEKKELRNQGLGSVLIKECIDDAKSQGLKGAAIVTRKSSWMAGSKLFLKNGFKLADTHPKDFELLVYVFDDVEMPRFSIPSKKNSPYMGKGLYIIYSDQCPYVRKFLNDIPPTLEEYEIKPRIIKIEESKQIRELANPYGTFTIIYDGKILEDHPISNTRFKNILKNSVLNRDD